MWVKLKDWHAMRDERDYFEGATTRCGKSVLDILPVSDLPENATICSACKNIMDKDQD